MALSRDIIKNTILRPSLERLGTIFAAALVGYGIADPVANQIAIGLIAALGVAADFAVLKFAAWRRKDGGLKPEAKT